MCQWWLQCETTHLLSGQLPHGDILLVIFHPGVVADVQHHIFGMPA